MHEAFYGKYNGIFRGYSESVNEPRPIDCERLARDSDKLGQSDN